MRRVALGLTALLLTARVYWPGEPDLKYEAGTGLTWDLAILITSGIAVAASLIGGKFRVRFSWVDVTVLGLMFLVGLSTAQAVDRRPAINLAWDWGALGVLYMLVRNVPRTRGESNALAAALVATAVAVSFYGLYQITVELPKMRADYRANKAQRLQLLGITPGSAAQYLFEKRLNESNEPTATFALTNSLAGFLLIPFVLILSQGWENLIRRKDPSAKGSPWPGLSLALLPTLLVAVCFLFTKSRSATVGVAVALAVLAFRERRRVKTSTLALAGLAGAGVLTLLIMVGLASKQLDILVLTQSTKSLRYRWEYWVGAWGVITESSNAFWKGHGPGNFTSSYLKYKLPESSEEIFDPHNCLLEVWSTAGTPAMVLFVLSIGLALHEMFGASSKSLASANKAKDSADPLDRDAAPPARSYWVVAWGAVGLLAAMGLGRLNPFEGDVFDRILLLGGGWLLAILLGATLWRRLPITAAAIGAGVLGLTINLLAAGGIGISSVAMMLWVGIALGLNLREDRWCGQLQTRGGRLPAFAPAIVWAALIGTFCGAVLPFWRSEAEANEAREALMSRPPQFERAEAAFIRAIAADPLSTNPYLGLAQEKMDEWLTRGAKIEDQRWMIIPDILADAMVKPRSPMSWTLHQYRANVIRTLVARIGSQMKPKEMLKSQGNIVKSLREASLLYPTNASLHAELALASADIGMYADAVAEAKEALKYHKLTPHDDKKLPKPIRLAIEEQLPKWEQMAPGGIPQAVKPKKQ
ncbi:O-antigen ligase family protein [Singulisphaera sp. PoT]|uniref:O-antigen ligase family protein n=1 Tax=Singulisphaera sp. PoT TaxID=3411797 RepID=UPI003BF5174D